MGGTSAGGTSAEGTSAAPDGGTLRGLDLASLTAFLESTRPGLLRGPLRATLIAGGRSNLTYALSDGFQRWVLRRPPLGHVLATAHDMQREFRVISALQSSAVPVPAPVLLSADATVLGAPFYLMDEVDGVVLRTENALDQYLPTPALVRSCLESLLEVLADLHRVEPADVGLADFGHPNGFLERQVRRWSRQLASSRSRDLPGADEVIEWLASAQPTPQRAAIVHGDYRLDNVIVDAERPDRILAVLDWEMATLGDPLADVGLFLVYYEQMPAGAGVISAGLPRRGGPAGRELVAHYAERAGLDVSDIDWYLVFGLFKIAVILEGIHYRFAQGLTVGRGFDQVGSLVQPLLDRARDVMRSA